LVSSMYSISSQKTEMGIGIALISHAILSMGYA
jgi:hypothetical protein